eukprot:202826_1
MSTLICCLCLCLVLGCLSLRKKRVKEQVIIQANMNDSVQMMPMTLPPTPGQPPTHTPFRPKKSDTNPRNNVNAFVIPTTHSKKGEEGAPNLIGNDAQGLYDMSAVHLPNLPGSYAHIQVEETSSSESSTTHNPMLVSPQRSIKPNGQNDKPNVNRFNEKQPFTNEGDYGGSAPRFRQKENHPNGGQKSITVDKAPYIRPAHVPNRNPNANAFHGHNQNQHAPPTPVKVNYNQNNRQNNRFNRYQKTPQTKGNYNQNAPPPQRKANRNQNNRQNNVFNQYQNTPQTKGNYNQNAPPPQRKANRNQNNRQNNGFNNNNGFNQINAPRQTPGPTPLQVQRLYDTGQM